MTYDPNNHHRRSIRLKDYDYSQAGAYFITICAHNRACLFGEIANGEMRLNDAGRMVTAEWNALPGRFPIIELDMSAVMPNHIHGIIIIAANEIHDDVGAGLVPARDGAPTNDAATRRATTRRATTRVAPTVGDIIGAFKSWTTVLYVRRQTIPMAAF